MWGKWRFRVYLVLAIVLVAFAGYNAWLAELVVERALETSDGPAATAAVHHLQLSVRSLWPLTLWAPLIIVWALFDYLLTPVRGRFTVLLSALTLFAVLLTALAMLVSFAGTVAEERPAVLAAMIMQGDVAVILSLIIGVWWLACVGGRIKKAQALEEAEAS